MKNLRLVRYLFWLVVLLLFHFSVFSYCGSVDIWYEKYSAASNDTERLNALMFIHCGPVVDTFDGNIESTAKLARMLQNALNKLEQENNKLDAVYVHHLVLKNYMRFRLWDKDHRVITLVEKGLAEFFDKTRQEFRDFCRAVPDQHSIYQEKDLGQSHHTYAKQLRREVEALKL